MKRFRLLLALTLLVQFTASRVLAQSPPRYTVIPLTNDIHPGGKCPAWAMNGRSQVVGEADDGKGNRHAFLWDPDSQKMQDLGTLPGGANSVAYGINNLGEVVGQSEVDAQGHVHAFLWPDPDQPGKKMMRDLGTLPGGANSVAYSINNRSQVVGSADTGSINYGAGMPQSVYHAFVWEMPHPRKPYLSISGLNDLTKFKQADYNNHFGTPPQFNSSAQAINDRGVIAGSIGDLSGTTIQAFTLSLKQLTTDPLTGYDPTSEPDEPQIAAPSFHAASGSSALAINDKGDVAGYSSNGPKYSLFFSPFVLAKIPVSPANSDAFPAAINNVGQIVGSQFQSNNYQAFLYLASPGSSKWQAYNINSYTYDRNPSDGILTRKTYNLGYAAGINDRGWIAADGGGKAYLLIPEADNPSGSAPLYTYDLTPWAGVRPYLGSGNIVDFPNFARYVPNPDAKRAWDEIHFAVSIQGIVNQQAADHLGPPQLYVYFIGRQNLDEPKNGFTDHYWLNYLDPNSKQASNCSHDATQLGRTDICLNASSFPQLRTREQLVNQFKNKIKGLVAWDPKVPATSNIASTIAGVKGLAVVRYDTDPDSLYTWATTKMGMHVVENLAAYKFKGKADAYRWAIALYQPLCNPLYIAYYPDAYWMQTYPHSQNGATYDAEKDTGSIDDFSLHRETVVTADRTLLSNHDFFIANRAFFVDLSPWPDEAPEDDPKQPVGLDTKVLTQVLQTAYSNPKASGKMIHVGGFPPWDQKYTKQTDLASQKDIAPAEFQLVKILSCFNAYLDADGPSINSMANASVFSWLNPFMGKSLPANHHPTAANTSQTGWQSFVNTDNTVKPGTYVTVYMGDYDSAAWLYNDMPKMWDDANSGRGLNPLAWAFSPALLDRFPIGFSHTRATQSRNDFFITGDSGLDYINPANLSANAPERKLWNPNSSDGREVWKNFCLLYYGAAGMNITGLINDGAAPDQMKDIKTPYTFPPPSDYTDPTYTTIFPKLVSGADAAAPNTGSLKDSNAEKDAATKDARDTFAELTQNLSAWAGLQGGVGYSPVYGQHVRGFMWPDNTSPNSIPFLQLDSFQHTQEIVPDPTDPDFVGYFNTTGVNFHIRRYVRKSASFVNEKMNNAKANLIYGNQIHFVDPYTLYHLLRLYMKKTPDGKYP